MNYSRKMLRPSLWCRNAPYRAGLTRSALFGSLLLLMACSSPAERAASARDEGEALAARGQHILARERFDTAVSLRDDQPELWVARARNLLSLGDYSGAFSSYSAALDLDRTNREALDAVGQIALLAGKSADAERIANQILTLAPDDPAALFVRGSVQLEGGRLDATAGTIEQGLRSNPDDENLLVLKSRLLARRNDLQAAERLLRPLYDRRSSNPLMLEQLATIYGRQFAGQELLAVRASAAKARPEDAAILFAFGSRLLASGSAADGLRVLQHAVERRKKPVEDRTVLLAIAESNITTDVLVSAIPAGPALKAETLLACARYAMLENRLVQARSILLGVPRDQRNRQWSALAAYLVARAENTSAAIRLADDVLEADAHAVFALAARALAYSRIGRLDESLRDGRMASSDAPRDVEPVSALATVMALKSGAVGERATYFEAYNRNRDNVLFLRALVLHDNRREAVVNLRAIVRDFTIRNPDVASGWSIRRSVCLILKDMPCAARAGAIVSSLAGRKVTIPAPPPEERSEITVGGT